MSLASSLFSGVSGLNTLGNFMTVIGDNIANVNTIGFKTSRVTFQDVLSQNVATTAGTGQVGRGTSLADIACSFSQGAFESTASSTDLAIGGDGFFVVRDPDDENNQYYTRAGEFRFDKDGNLVNPAGYIVRGWVLDQDTGEDVGSITDIVLQSFTSAPKETDKLTAIVNVDFDAESKSADLAVEWNGADPDGNYINENAYEYQTTVKVFDSLGSIHDISIYYDKGGSTSYEFIVTCNPGEDKRSSLGLTSTDAGLGMLAKGIITFNEESGVIEDISFSKFIGEAGGVGAASTWAGASTATATSYGQYTGAVVPSTFTFTASVAGGPSVISATGTSVAFALDYDNGTESGTIAVPTTYKAGEILTTDYGIEISLAAGNVIDLDTFTVDITAGDADNLADPNCWANMTETNDLTNGYFTFDTDFLGGTDTKMNIELNIGSSFNTTTGNWANDFMTTTQYSAASTTTYQSATGYGVGDLQSVSVTTDGVITGQYTNGQVIPLFRVTLAKFQNNQGLFKVGGNLYRETRLSGDPVTSKPGSGGLGNISPNSLEQSNVDIANEFVKMITTQRGFQANSKIITTTDQMLSDIINLKR
ncbi:MAG: flagellar hook-basal body complex protein [Desulfobacterales bacterium]|nr:flagellar hook-basal body complex protein [Desulfobacterales bacterium]